MISYAFSHRKTPRCDRETNLNETTSHLEVPSRLFTICLLSLDLTLPLLLFPQGEQPCIRLLDDFRLSQGRHVCIVMEALDQSLRKVLRTHGRGKGISYKAVRTTPPFSPFNEKRES